MINKKYIGHPSQICGVFEVRAVGGKADGMRLLEVRNGIGLEFTISLDRCADIPYLYFNGNSMAYIAPCGLVAPTYYDKTGAGFLKSFTAGFLTTCGLTSAGSSCEDMGEVTPLHGNISHVPCEQFSYNLTEEFIKITAKIRDASLFSHQLLMEREYICSLNENKLIVTDVITNIGCRETPYMTLYHCNMGYPLLSENSVLKISSSKVEPRNEHSAKDINSWDKIIPPADNFTEQCYYHSFDSVPFISLSNPDIKTELQMSFDNSTLNYFTQWKMMGNYEYVMGLEPGNCHPDGRNIMRKENTLKFLKPGESSENRISFKFIGL